MKQSFSALVLFSAQFKSSDEPVTELGFEELLAEFTFLCWKAGMREETYETILLESRAREIKGELLARALTIENPDDTKQVSAVDPDGLHLASVLTEAARHLDRR